MQCRKGAALGSGVNKGLWRAGLVVTKQGGNSWVLQEDVIACLNSAEGWEGGETSSRQLVRLTGELAK